MKRIIFLTLIMAVLIQTPLIMAQSANRPKLAILPFTGSSNEDGDIIANIFSNQPSLQQAFTVQPRTKILDDIFKERRSQLSGITDSDTLADVGRLLEADYVLSGSVTKLANRNLLIATIVNVATFELVAGSYLTYDNLGDVPQIVPVMTKAMSDAVQARGARTRETLGIFRFAGSSRVSASDSQTLIQILAIELASTNKFAVLPRNTAMEAARAESERTGITGRAANAEFVVVGTISALGNANIFDVKIMVQANNSLRIGINKNYQQIDEGINLMSEMAIRLTQEDYNETVIQRRLGDRRSIERERQMAAAQAIADSKRAATASVDEARRAQETVAAAEKARRDVEEASAKRERDRIATEAQRERERIEAEAQKERERSAAVARKEAKAKELKTSARRNELEGFNASYVWEEGLPPGKDKVSGFRLGAFLSGMYWSFLPFVNIGAELTVSALSFGNVFDYTHDTKTEDFKWFFNLTPTIGTVIPLSGGARIFVNGLLEMGSMPFEGKIYHNDMPKVKDFNFGLTPGLNAGFSFGRSGTFTMYYRGILYNDPLKDKNGHKKTRFINAIGLGFGKMF